MHRYASPSAARRAATMTGSALLAVFARSSTSDGAKDRVGIGDRYRIDYCEWLVADALWSGIAGAVCVRLTRRGVWVDDLYCYSVGETVGPRGLRVLGRCG